MARPYWSGQIQISLVSFGVKLFTATESKSEVRFHQLSRKTGERIKHQKVSGDEGKVESSDIVKGYEYRKGEYITIEPEEIEQIRIPSKHTLEVTQFVDLDELAPEFFEKPYFVVPENDVQAEAFAVVRKALQTTKKIALGKIAFSGREHLVAVSAGTDDKLPGMMAYTMRYSEELRKPKEFFEDIKKVAVDEDQLSLAKELIKRKASKFDPEKFKDEYETALREMIEAKVKHAPISQEEPAPMSGKVVNLMDALRKSVQGDEAVAGKKKAPATAAAQKGIELVKPAKAHKPRKSA
ncbi:Ku protein [Granulicella sp. S190]|uniref:non-homologous end joining protein Ku n=1 Tax=Granulicella sp. S190 TaxID=1747226 RepID=UPI00131CE0B0|nr:Ku protein [Granulicella sp. S190]